MRRRVSYRLMAMALLALTYMAGGCTHNDGDIGDWFGMWLVERIEVDSEEVAGYSGNVVLKFQGGVMESSTMMPYHEQVSYFANCRIESDALIVGVGSGAEWPDGFAPELMLPAAAELRLQVTAFGGGRAVLRWNDAANGNVYDYYLKKLYD